MKSTLVNGETTLTLAEHHFSTTFDHFEIQFRQDKNTQQDRKLIIKAQ